MLRSAVTTRAFCYQPCLMTFKLDEGAHRDTKQMAAYLKRALNDALRQVIDLKPKELLQRRYERLQSYGRFNDTTDR